MERKLDAIESFQEGYKQGQAVVLKMVNEYCGFSAENVQQLIHAINEAIGENHVQS